MEWKYGLHGSCNGECPKNRFIKTPEDEPGLNYFCAGYREFFRHIDGSMRFMANELRQGREPANVMKYTASDRISSVVYLSQLLFYNF